MIRILKILHLAENWKTPPGQCTGAHQAHQLLVSAGFHFKLPVWREAFKEAAAHDVVHGGAFCGKRKMATKSTNKNLTGKLPPCQNHF